MFDLGRGFILYLAGKALLCAGMIATIACVITGADVGTLVSIGVMVVGAALALEGA